MNYYPYFNSFPYMNAAAITKPSLFKSLFGGLSGIKWGSILSGTQKTLNVVNQAIPIIKEARPVLNNAKTMFKVMSEFKKVDSPTKKVNTISSSKTETIKKITNNNPTFFQ